MYSSYYYPLYRALPYMPLPYPYPYYNPYLYGNTYSSNTIGSAIANQNLVNTGTAIGVSQVANPTVIW